MKVAVLFSGGKDSVYAAYLAKKQGHKLVCLISVVSENKESYMFHTPNILETKKQAKVMCVPLVIQNTKGEKERELKDLEKILKKVKRRYKVKGIVTGAIQSAYQATRIQKICDNLELKCINPLWQKNEEEYLNDLIKNKFKIIVVGVFAYPLDQKWLGKMIDEKFISQVEELNRKYKIHVAGEGGEFETFVLDCPLFSKSLKVVNYKDFKEGENSWRREIEVK
jgi:ABC transporter with metal-binding/Fe-S-binding domain ATP-binding protein